MDILRGSIKKTLISLSFPISIGMVTTFLFQLVDSYFVGQIGSDALTAVGFSSSLMLILMSVFMGLSTGISIIIADYLGRESYHKVSKSVIYGFLITLFLAVLLSFVTYLFLTPIFTLLGISTEVLQLTTVYTIPLLFSLPFFALGLFANATLRSKGSVVSPQVVMVAAGLINFIFDYLLIFGNYGFPNLGVEGAAYASVLSWMTMFIGMMILLLRSGMLKPKPNKEKVPYLLNSFLVKVKALALPAVLTQAITPITIMYLTLMLARQSELAVAAFGVASRIQTLLMVGSISLGTAMTPFIAQNKGSEQHERIKQAILFGERFNLYIGIFLAIILFLFAKQIVAIFTDSAEIIHHASNYFYILAISYMFFGFYNVINSSLNGLGKTIASLKVNLFQSFVLMIPLTLIGSYWGVNGIFIGTAISYIFTAFYARHQMRMSCTLPFKQPNINHTNPFI